MCRRRLGLDFCCKTDCASVCWRQDRTKRSVEPLTGDFKHSFKAAQREELSLTVYNTGFQKCPPGYGWGPGVRDHYLLHYIVSGRGGDVPGG